MKNLFVLFVSVTTLFLVGCAIDRPLISDEDYNKYRGPAPYSPDPMSHIPNQNQGY